MLLFAPATKLGMSSVAGLGIGICFADETAWRLLGDFQEHAETFEACLQKLNRDRLTKLRQFAEVACDILETA